MDDVKEDSKQNDVETIVAEENHDKSGENKNELLDGKVTSVDITNTVEESEDKESNLLEDIPSDFFDDFMKKEFVDGFEIIDEFLVESADEEGKSPNEENSAEINKTDKPIENQRKDGDNTTEKEEQNSADIKKTDKPIENQQKDGDNTTEKEEQNSADIKKTDKPIENQQKDGDNTTEKEEKNSADTKKTDKLIENQQKDGDNTTEKEKPKTKTSNKEKSDSKKKRRESKKKCTTDVEIQRVDYRRDPEKTRHAIQRDKVYSAKEKEKQLVTDIVETGLVPPGMELEVDVNKIHEIAKQQNRSLPLRESRDRSLEKSAISYKDIRKNSDRASYVRPMRSRSPSRRVISPSRRGASPSRRGASPIRRGASPSRRVVSPSRRGASPSRRGASPSRRGLSPSRRGVSPIRRGVSPIRRGPSPSRRGASPIRRCASPIRRGASPIRRGVSPIRRGASPIRRRLSPTERGHSPRRSLYRKRVIVSPIYRRKSRNRTPSPRRSRDKESRRGNTRNRSRSRSRSIPRKKRKEEKLSFLEELAVKLNAPLACGNHVEMEQRHISQSPYGVQKRDDKTLLLKELANKLNASSCQSNPVQSVPVQPLPVVPMNVGSMNISQFFDDNLIKLSDLLAISAKSQVNVSAQDEEKKSKVIQRCQVALKVLSEKPTGELLVKNTGASRTLAEQNVSPLYRKMNLKFPFTTSPKKSEREDSFANLCRNFLNRIDSEMDAPAIIKSAPAVSDYYDELSEPTVVTACSSTQTDPGLMACSECKRRSNIRNADSCTQTSYPGQFSVGTNVTEANFYSMIPKTQSLASLTPAQLLGKLAVAGETNTKTSDYSTMVNRNRTYDPPARSLNAPPAPPSMYEVDPRYSTVRPGSQANPGASADPNQAWPPYNGANWTKMFKRY